MISRRSFAEEALAAGLDAPALAALDGVEPRKVDVPRLQEAIVATGGSIRRDPERVARERANAVAAVKRDLASGKISYCGHARVRSLVMLECVRWSCSSAFVGHAHVRSLVMSEFVRWSR